MESRVRYTAVGLFVVGFGTALVLAFIWLATRDSLEWGVYVAERAGISP